MKTIINKIKSIPWYGWVAGLVLFGLQYGLYRLANVISVALNFTPVCPKIDAIDDLIKVIPVFVIPYIFSYVFWICGPIAVSLTSKKNFINYLIGLLSAYLIGFLIFIFFPTYMSRSEEGIIDGLGTDIFSKLLAMIYGNDGGDLAFNLFPSYHCLISLYCYLGIRKQPEIAKGFKIYSGVMVILICLSTVFTKQHYFIDIVGGISISLSCYLIIKQINPGKKILLNRKKSIDKYEG